jgi:hypothetical protein
VSRGLFTDIGSGPIRLERLELIDGKQSSHPRNRVLG